MNLPNTWNQGQIFAFSALDGEAIATDDFTGILSGDRIGIRFFVKVKRELALVGFSKTNPIFKAVLGDFILMENDLNETTSIIYADTHLVIGNTFSGVTPVVFVEGKVDVIQYENIEIQDTLDGDFTALAFENGRFAFTYGKSKDEVISNIKKGLALDIAVEQKKKLKIYETVSTPKDEEYSRLYNKCISTMKTQLYSPEGKFKRIWSTPDRQPHKALWLWDSVFHSIGFRNLDGKLAEDLVLAIFDNQNEDGFIPHLAYPNYCSDVTQPPVIAWGAYLVFQKTQNLEFIKTVFENNKKFLLWCHNNRRERGDELYSWYTDEDIHCRCGESGMDNSPRFDTHNKLQAIDFSCFMANEARYMKKLADIIGNEKESAYFDEWYNRIKNDINNKLWCEEDSFYYDYDLNDKKHHKIQSIASFLPLFSGICDPQKAQLLFGHLTNKETFYTEFPIPSISKKDKTFGSDMWRGPVWINYNYMIALGLYDYGFNDFAKEIELKTIDFLNNWYKKAGVMFEFYDCENKKAPYELNRKGTPYEPYDLDVRVQSIRDYGWSTTLLFDLLNKHFVY